MEGIYAHADLLKVYKAILDSTQEIAVYLRYHSVPVVPHSRVVNITLTPNAPIPYSSTNQCLQSTSCPSRTSSARRSPTST
ncbi:hypothetical protein FGO68_gene12468 [Halteria grandinella]|uniref:Uncharacterized protein n=1 Tax=Halteria grandinella TaxID=5974 RepID=A0A8J8NC93_HALGN|nr:hypothetical protein FGO68_gene12468 [Halteria grandinella]